MLEEYLFLDKRRIEAYVEQIGPPITYDKLPAWTVEIGMTGPRAVASQHRRYRALTMHESLEQLLSHLKGGHLLSELSPSLDDYPHHLQFFLHSCELSKCILPAGAGGIDTFPGLTLWLNFEPDLLCLLEDFWKTDYSPGDYGSSRSILTDLLVRIRKDIGKGIFESVFDVQRGSTPEYFDELDHTLSKFAADPATFLQRLNCTPMPKRRVRVLYRVRDSHLCEDRSLHVYGYPIFIAEEPLAL